MTEYDFPGHEVRTKGGGLLRVSVERRRIGWTWRVLVRTVDGEAVVDERCADRDEALMRADYWSERLSGGLTDP